MKHPTTFQIRIGSKIYTLGADLLIAEGAQAAVYRHPKYRKLAIRIVFQPQPSDQRRYESQIDKLLTFLGKRRCYRRCCRGFLFFW